MELGAGLGQGLDFRWERLRSPGWWEELVGGVRPCVVQGRGTGPGLTIAAWPGP